MVKDKLKKMYDGELVPDVNGAYDLAMKRYTPKAMALAIKNRLKEIL